MTWTALTLYVPGISWTRLRLLTAGIPRSNLDAPLTMYAHLSMTVSSRVRFTSAHPRTTRGTSPALITPYSLS